MRKIKNVKSAPTPIFDNQIWRLEQVCEVLGFARSTVYGLVKENKIPFRKRGKTLFFMSKEIFEWIDKGVA